MFFPTAIMSGLAGFAVSASANNLSLFTICGSPTVAGAFTVIINSGVVIGSTTTATAALVSGTFPAGSTVTLINNGKIYGKEGAGGSYTPQSPGVAGRAGGPAMSLSFNVSIDNTAGNIFGGGGGGGGGGSDAGTGGPGGTGQGFGNQSAPGTPSATTGAGDGGAWGTAGSSASPISLADGSAISGGAGGAAGKAIALNGKTATFIAGNTAALVKGAVS